MKSISYSFAAALVAILAVSPARADYSSTVRGLNPVAYYRLNETTPVPADIATNLGTAGTLGTALYLNFPFQQQPGALVGSPDTAVGFSGNANTKDRVALPFDPALNPSGTFTAEGWFNPAVADGTFSPLSYWTEGGTGAPGRTGWLIYQIGGTWEFRMYNGTNTATIVDISAGGAIVAGTWYHLAAVYDGANASFYVNGALAGQQPLTGYAVNVGGPFSIGARSDGNFWFAGYADEVVLYTNALSASEIMAHYQNGINPSPSQTYESLVLAQHPLLYYRLNDPVPPGEFPVVAENLGSLGVGADGQYEAGALTGVAGPPFAGFNGGNTAMRISPLAGDVVIPAGQPINTNVFTITCWYKRTGLHFAGQALVFNRYDNQSAATGLGFGYNGSPGVDQLNVHWNEGPSSWQTGLIPPNDIWCFGAAVYTPTNVTVYLNEASNTLNTPLSAHDFSQAPIYIGWDFPYPRFGGAIDEVALFDRALSPAEVQSIFSASEMPAQILSVTRTPPDPLFEGYNVTMYASAAGVSPLTYQWYKNNSPLTGKTSTVLAIENVTLGDSGNYTIVATNPYGSSTGAVQTITISSGPPFFQSENIYDATRALGGRVTYSVMPGGSFPMSYQWKHGSTAIAGATTSVLNLSNLQISDAGSYSVTLSNSYGTTNSTAGILTVFAVTNYPYAALYYNPLAYYRFSETSGTTASDYASGLNGTLNGPIVTGVAGPQAPTWSSFFSTNVSFQFDGASTRVQLPPFNLKTNQMTIVAFINPASIQSDQTGILVSRSPTGLGGFFLNYNNNNALSYVWEGTDSWWQFQSGLVPVIGQWNFVALVIDPTKGTVYLDDGTGLQSAVYTPSQGNKTVVWDSPNIGVDLGYNRWFYGDIDEVAVYDRALTAAEIANLDLLSTTWPGPKPQILAQPESTTVFAGQPASFTVTAIGALPLSYQWRKSGTSIAGLTIVEAKLPSAYFTDAGDYDVQITNPVGTSTSQPATLTVLAPPTFANLTNDLVLHLKFDGDYVDSSGRHNDAVPIGAPVLVPGRLGMAMHYNTDNTDPNNVIYNYASLGTPSDLFVGSQDFSVSYWIRFTGTSWDLPVLCNNNCGEGCTGLYIGPSYNGYVDGSWAWSFADINTIDVDGAPNVINDGQWHNVVSTFDRTGLGITYLDGQMVSAVPIDTFNSILDTGFPMNVGQVGTADYQVNFGADVDDIGFWLRALSPTEAEGIYMAAQNDVSFDTYGPVILSIQKVGSDIDLVWQAGTLLQSDTINGTYSPVPGATAPFYRVTPGPGSKFYRVQL